MVWAALPPFPVAGAVGDPAPAPPLMSPFADDAGPWASTPWARTAGAFEADRVGEGATLDWDAVREGAGVHP